ncbi:MAG TPA: hypothetical protein VMC09_04415 [Anaerolineales bacterium]|nr:hypothetical protein [Anaerolineales bacterium]
MSASDFSPKLTASIVKRLSHAEDRDDIVLDLCQATGLTWEDVDARVRSIEDQNRLAIERMQSPLMITLAFSSFLAGLAFMVYGMYSIIAPWIASPGKRQSAPDLTICFSGSHASRICVFSFPPRPDYAAYLAVAIGLIFNPASGILLGAGMVTGSLLGMRDVWSQLLDDLDSRRRTRESDR